MNRLSLRGLLILLLLGRAATLQAASNHVDSLILRLVRDDDRRFHIEAEAQVRAPQAVVWETVRDYDHMSSFVPMLAKSHRCIYQNRPAIEQLGKATFLFLTFQAKTVLEEVPDPNQKRLTLHAVAGDFSTFDSHWTFRPIGPFETQVTLKSEAVLKRWLPQWLARRELKKNVRLSLEALIREMEKRAAGAEV